MFDVKTRQSWLRENAEMLKELASCLEQNPLAATDARYAGWISQASDFSSNFFIRARLYDGTEFRNAKSDAELRKAASDVANLFQFVFNRHETQNQFKGDKLRPSIDDGRIKREFAYSEEINFIYDATERTAGSDGLEQSESQ